MPEGVKRTAYFIADAGLAVDVSLSKEHDNFAWVPLDEAITLTWFPEMADLLRAATAMIVGDCGARRGGVGVIMNE